MAEDGDNSALRMLMDHLTKVKLAAEETEWRLKNDIKALEAALRSMEQQQQSCEDELDMAKNTIYELKTQMSKKWRLEALDDWKALVKYVVGRCHFEEKKLDDLTAACLFPRHPMQTIECGPVAATERGRHAQDGE
jgi:phage-related tail protein